ncbi:MAG: hypothetical protein ACLSG5_03325 [Oscillospiraceae bacterium]
MKGLGIALVGILAVAGGIAAATIITKKKLEGKRRGLLRRLGRRVGRRWR